MRPAGRRRRYAAQAQDLRRPERRATAPAGILSPTPQSAVGLDGCAAIAARRDRDDPAVDDLDRRPRTVERTGAHRAISAETPCPYAAIGSERDRMNVSGGNRLYIGHDLGRIGPIGSRRVAQLSRKVRTPGPERAVGLDRVAGIAPGGHGHDARRDRHRRRFGDRGSVAKLAVGVAAGRDKRPVRLEDECVVVCACCGTHPGHHLRRLGHGNDRRSIRQLAVRIVAPGPQCAVGLDRHRKARTSGGGADIGKYLQRLGPRREVKTVAEPAAAVASPRPESGVGLDREVVRQADSDRTHAGQRQDRKRAVDDAAITELPIGVPAPGD